MLILVFGANPAKAVLDYNIYESLGNVVVEASGSINLPISIGLPPFGWDSALIPASRAICNSQSTFSELYLISGPSSFQGFAALSSVTSVSSITTAMNAGQAFFLLDPSCISGSPIISDAIFVGITLADIGLTPAFGVLGTWTLEGTGETINVNVVPGPLSLAGAAFSGAGSRPKAESQSFRLSRPGSARPFFASAPRT